MERSALLVLVLFGSILGSTLAIGTLRVCPDQDSQGYEEFVLQNEIEKENRFLRPECDQRDFNITMVKEGSQQCIILCGEYSLIRVIIVGTNGPIYTDGDNINDLKLVNCVDKKGQNPKRAYITTEQRTLRKPQWQGPYKICTTKGEFLVSLVARDVDRIGQMHSPHLHCDQKRNPVQCLPADRNNPRINTKPQERCEKFDIDVPEDGACETREERKDPCSFCKKN